MSIEKYSSALRTHGTLAARIFIGGLFLLAGIDKLTGDGGVATFSQYIPEALPAPLLIAWIVTIIEIVGGAALILGFYFYKAAAALFTFVLLTVIFVHADLKDPMLMKNLAIMGGLLYMLAYGQGNGWWLGKKNGSGHSGPTPSM